MDITERIIDRREIYKGDFLILENLKIELPNKKITNRDIIRHPGAVALLAFKDKETIIMVEQFRMAINKELLEIPAGKIENNELPLESAKRELEEETGYKAEKIEYIGEIVTAPGFTDEVIYLYKATKLYKGIIGGDDDEFINVKEFKINEIESMIKSGKINDAKTIASFMYL